MIKSCMLNYLRHLIIEKRNPSSGIILFIGLFSSILVSIYVYKKNLEEDKIRLNYESNLVVRRILSRMRAYEGVLIQTRAFLLNSKANNFNSLKNFIRDTEIFERSPGLQGLGYALAVQSHELSKHLKEMTKETPNYRLWPITPKETHYPIVVLEPEDWRNKKAIGYDMYEEEIRRKAMERARDTNDFSLSDRITLVQETGDKKLPGFNLYLPHYKNGADLSSIEERRKALQGFVYSPFRAPELFKAIFSEMKMVLDVEIYTNDSFTKENQYYDSSIKRNDQTNLQVVKTINLYDKILYLKFIPLKNFSEETSFAKSLSLFFLGIILTFTIFGLFLITRNQMMAARAFAQEKVKLLIKEKEHVMARDDFLSIASHELKTPLTSLKLQSQVLMRAIEKNDPTAFSPERITNLVKMIDNQTTRLTRLVDDMLDISRIKTGRLRIQLDNVKLNDVIYDVCEKLKPQFTKILGQGPILELQSDIEGYWDRFRLEQVLTNLLTNALRYGNQKPVTIKTKKENGLAKILVIDQGIGISNDNQQKIFNRFERAGMSASEVSGLGLGLFITNQIVMAHGGKIEVQSELSKGSVFKVSLPTRN